MTVGLRHLRAFLAIADERNITRAAARLHVTQPALSRTLRDLEAHLGVRLVDRSTHHLELTPAGRTFRDRAAAAVAAVDEALDPALAGTWPLRIGHAWSAFGAYTPSVLRRWQERYPETPVELLRFDDRSAGLASGAADLSVLRAPVRLAGVRAEPLLTEARFAAVPSGRALAARDALTLADLSGETIALNVATGTTTLDLWPRETEPAGTVNVVNTDDWLAAIAAGRAVGVTTAATAAMYPSPGVTYVPLTDAPAVTVLLAWREPPGHPAVAAFVALAREVVRDM